MYASVVSRSTKTQNVSKVPWWLPPGSSRMNQQCSTRELWHQHSHATATWPAKSIPKWRWWPTHSKTNPNLSLHSGKVRGWCEKGLASCQMSIINFCYLIGQMGWSWISPPNQSDCRIPLPILLISCKITWKMVGSIIIFIVLFAMHLYHCRATSRCWARAGYPSSLL